MEQVGPVRITGPPIEKKGLVPEAAERRGGYAPYCPFGSSGPEEDVESGKSYGRRVGGQGLASGGSKIAGISSEKGVDLDGDGLFDLLVLGVEVNATADFSGSLSGVLSYNGTYVGRDFEYGYATRSMAGLFLFDFKRGLNLFYLNFSGLSVYESGFDGVYSTGIFLCGLGENATHEDSKEFNLSSYFHGSFQRPPLEIVGAWEYGLDADGDGLFDFLAFDVGFGVWQPDNYSVYGHLEYPGAPAGTESIQTRGYLGRGVHNVTLLFGGADVYRLRVNGSMRLDVYASSDGGYYSRAFNTSAHEYGRFRRPKLELTGQYSDAGVGEGKYLSLKVIAGAYVRESGEYGITSSLYGKDDKLLSFVFNRTHLDAGSQNITLYFDGVEIQGRGIDGPYILYHLRLVDANASVAYEVFQVYNTSNYSFADFEGGGSIYGVVTDDSGAPASGLAVDIEPGSFAITEQNGSFSIAGLRKGDYVLRIDQGSDSHFLPSQPKNVSLEPGSSVSVNFSVSKGSLVRLKAFGPGGVPADADISLGKCSMALDPMCVEKRGSEDGCYVGSCHYLSSAVVDGSGYYVIPKIAPGNYTLNVRPRSPNFKEFDRDVVVLPGENVLNVSLLQCGSISGMVTGRGGAPVTAALVQVVGYETPFSHVCERPAECRLGSYIIPCIEPGEYEVRAIAASGSEIESVHKRTVVGVGRTSTLDLELDI